MKRHEILSKSGDIRLKAEGTTLEDLFRASLEGMSELIKEGAMEFGTGDIEKAFSISSPEPSLLLVDFLSKVLSYTHMFNAVFCEVEFNEIGDQKIKAKVFGREIEGFDTEIRAVVYHEVDVKQTSKGHWEALVVFDV